MTYNNWVKQQQYKKNQKQNICCFWKRNNFNEQEIMYNVLCWCIISLVKNTSLPTTTWLWITVCWMSMRLHDKTVCPQLLELWRLKTSCACQPISSSKEKASTTLTWLSQYTGWTGHPRETIALLWRRMSRASAARAHTEPRCRGHTRVSAAEFARAEGNWLQIHEYYSRPEVLSRFCQTRKKIPVAPPPCITSSLKSTVCLSRLVYLTWTEHLPVDIRMQY